MNRLGILLLILSTACLPGLAGKVQADTPPNIILIYADDFPWYGTSVQMEAGDEGSYTSYQRSPNIDELATQGLTFSRAYAPAGLCGPSRASLQLGMTTARSRYTANTGNPDTGSETPGIKDNNSTHILDEPTSYIHLPTDQLTMGQAMQSLGYATAHYGKWHLWGGGPGNYGYDDSDGETSNDEGNENLDPDNDPKLMFSITQDSIDFMNTQVAADKPFFIQLSHYATHGGFQYRPETKAYYEGLPAIEEALPGNNSAQNTAENTAAMFEDLDTSIGMLLDEVDNLGLADNTYIVFTSDNGIGRETGSNYLRGDKWWLWDNAIRVPMIVRGPNIPAGTRSDTNVIHYDFLQTFFDWGGGDLSTLPEELDGESLMALMESPEVAPEYEDRSLFFHYPHVRESTPQSAVIKGTEKLMIFYERPDELFYYDTSVDPFESFNLGFANSQAQALKDEFDQYLAAVRDDPYTLPVSNPDSDPANVPLDPDVDIPPRLIYLPDFLWGDINGDDVLNELDIDAFIDVWKTDTSGFANDLLQHEAGDLNFDGITDFGDLFILRGLLNASLNASGNSAAVPEPASFLLAVGSLLALQCHRQHRKS